MEKPNKILTIGDYYYVYDPGYLEKKCIDKLCEVVQEYQSTMDGDAELYKLKKQIEKLHKKYNTDEGSINDAC